MHRLPPEHRSPSSWFAALGVGLAIGLPGASAAEPVETAIGPSSYRLAPALARPRPPAWLGEKVYFKKGVGLEYRRELKLGAHPIELGFQGPIVRKKKRVGLTFEVRF